MTSTPTHFDLIVIGSGSAGSSCWYAARQMDKSVAVFDGATLGGECPTYACVPTKALLHCAEVYDTVKGAGRFGINVGDVRADYKAVKAWKDRVVSQTGAALGEAPYHEMGVQVVRHHARFVDPHTIVAGGERYTAERFLVSTGASQRTPDIEGLTEAGFLTFRDAIDLEEAPGSLFVLGGGAVGCEFTQLFGSFGTQVYLSDRNARLLHMEDPEVGDFLAHHFEGRDVQLLLESSVTRVRLEDGRKVVTVSKDGATRDVAVDEILVATGKAPNVDLGLEAANITYDRARGVTVDKTLLSTNPRVYAAGDVAGPFRFTHAASYQGNLACHNMFSGTRHEVDYSAMPRCVFTTPEVATVGMTRAQARDAGYEVRTGTAGIDASDRALTSGEMNGFVKVIAAADGRLLGGAAISPRAGELIHELALAIHLGASAQDVASTIHAFPTFSEVLAAACAEV